MTIPGKYPSKYRGSKEYFLVYCELISAACSRGTLTYSEVADIMGLPPSGNYMGREVGQMLGEISQNEYHAGRPLLSAVAVSKRRGVPGRGFFGLAREFGKLQDNTTEEDERRFWEEEKAAVYAAWEKPLKSK